jgi:uncharacterized protein YwgA
MTAYDFVHLVLHASGGRVEGRTKLQKLVYFVGALTGDLDRLGYRPHHYGPFSPEVAGAVQELRGLKFLQQHISPRGTIDSSGFEYTRYDYVLTEEGEEVAEDKATARPEEWKRITDAVQKVTAANAPDYVRLAIAAKTHLLTQRAGHPLSGEDLKTQTAAHGWNAFTQGQYDEALRFLERVGLKDASANS